MFDKIERLFPVQEKIIPVILNQNNAQSIYPNDLCVIAPTGSGKTLTYVLPIVEKLKNRIRPCIRAIVLLPVNDLADQVHDVFRKHSVNTDLKIALLSTKHPFGKEQASLIDAITKTCQYDILVATPGRLVDHIQRTSGFNLKDLKFLVIDECDRIMDQIKQNWLPCLYSALYSERSILTSDHLNVHNIIINKEKLRPFQKLLFSATLTRDPEKLEQIKLFQPEYHTIAAEKFNNNDHQHATNKSIAENGVNNGKTSQPSDRDMKSTKTQLNDIDSTVPKELDQSFIQCSSFEKPIVVIYLLKVLQYRHVLCFVKSIDTAKRLCKLLELHSINAAEYSSSLHVARRKRIIAKFEQKKVDVLVCSDLIARGMDLSNVDYVLLYDAPKDLNSYIHRVGRTARAGRIGTAITLLEHKEIYFFKKLLGTLCETGDDNKKLKEIKITKSKLKPLMVDFKSSLTKLKDVLKKK
jgi:ATP-dependent RNA helicase DDX51/DBP6